jgi:DNA-directed RNA polymerase subunit RPC12/RpoP
MENNFVIDYAKTLYKPQRPKHLKDKINDFTNNKVPHFFMYAKDKNESQIESRNESFINKLDYKIKDRRIDSRITKLKSVDYRILMNNPNIKCNVVSYENGRINEELTDPMIVKYFELNNEYHFKLDNIDNIDIPRDGQFNNSQLKEVLFFKKVGDEIKTELSKFGYTDSEVADILVKLLYHVKPSSHKSVLWFAYGDYILENIKRYKKESVKVIQCVDCGEWFEVNIKDTESCRCEECASRHKRELARLRKERQRKKKNVTLANECLK